LTSTGANHSGRIAGLVYLDATADPTDDYTEYNALVLKLPEPIRNSPEWKPPAPSPEDRASFHAFQEWQKRTRAVAMPESELRNEFETNEDGSVGRSKIRQGIPEAIRAGGKKRDYSRITVPILAFSWFPPSVEDRMKTYPPADAQARAAIEAVRASEVRIAQSRMQKLLAADAPVHAIETAGANHYIFITDGDAVLRELRAFLGGQ
jgi:pimeloyl-ACP methyl ester carboxylesterase